METLNSDRLSIKNLLFTKALPNYTIPSPINGHKIYCCTDCGDKFVFESSLNTHINRKSAKINYNCRHCTPKVFYNRCNLLSHIRSHVFKTATINVTDLKVEPLPLSCYKNKPTLPPEVVASSTTQTTESETLRNPTFTSVVCYECKKNITSVGIAYKDRATHFMQYTNEVYSCPICLFALPSICALKVHMRLHIKCPPYYCPECGVHLTTKNVHYPYNHDCEGFNMMRATARLNCSAADCCLFHPNDYKDHMRKYHLKMIYKCPSCVVACFSEATMTRHLKEHKNVAAAPVIFYQCSLCRNQYVMENSKYNNPHLKTHINTTIYPCWACGAYFKEVSSLLVHFLKKHNKNKAIESALNYILADSAMHNTDKAKRIYRVVKRCDQCTRSFTYKCKYEDIRVLPSECPYKCKSGTMASNDIPDNSGTSDKDGKITCHLCRDKISQNWSDIKKHYAELHKTHKCLDAKIVLTRVNVTKYLSQNKIAYLNKVTKKPRNKKTDICPSPFTIKNVTNEGKSLCNICRQTFDDKSAMEKHMVSHKDQCMAYQCLECGLNYVDKSEFADHLLLEHDITDADCYILNKQCYNPNAMNYILSDDDVQELPLEKNQCRICREKFNGPEDLNIHFRTHGRAMLFNAKYMK